MKVAVSIEQKARFDLPADMSRELGRVMTRWAYFEHYLQMILWAIAFDGHKDGAKLGRVAIREPRAEDRLDMIQDAAAIRKFYFDKALLKSIRKRAIPLNGNRDLIAHGKWTHTAHDGWIVQQVRGKWAKDPNEKLPRGSRRIIPESLPFDAARLREIWTAIEALIADARKLALSIDRGPAPSPHKSVE
jgi:hypothetical protein